MLKFNIYHVNAGWRVWSFLKIDFPNSVYGWSEFTVSNSQPSTLSNAIAELIKSLDDTCLNSIRSTISYLRLLTRQSEGGIINQAISAIENALWDAKARSLSTSVIDLMGGKLIPLPLYWSHCGTSRVRAAQYVNKPQINSVDNIDNLISDIIQSNVQCIKTNIVLADSQKIYMPGFGRENPNPSGIYMNNKVSAELRSWLCTLREKLPVTINLAVDLNYNHSMFDVINLAKCLENLSIDWVEIDCSIIQHYRKISNKIPFKISTGENFSSLSQFIDCIQDQSCEIFGIDCQWYGLSNSLCAAMLASENNILISPHNFNGYLSTYISGSFSCLLNNLYLLEYDYDDVPWRDELFTRLPSIKNGFLNLGSDLIGWGTEPCPKALKKYKSDK